MSNQVRAGAGALHGPRRCRPASTLPAATAAPGADQHRAPTAHHVILGIESSCDDSAAAIVDCSIRGGRITSATVAADVVAAQHKLHAPYAGIVPHFAVRAHEINLPLVSQAALDAFRARVPQAATGAGGGVVRATASRITRIAVTTGPGLAVCLRAGVEHAAVVANKERATITPVHHLEAHLLVPRLACLLESGASDVDAALPFPYLVVLVSGGHSQLVLAKRVGEYVILGRTLDDSLGEAFDKAARMLRVWLHVAPGLPRSTTGKAEAPGSASAAAAIDLDTGVTLDQLAGEACRSGGPQLTFTPFSVQGAVRRQNSNCQDDGEADAAGLARLGGHLGAAVEALAAEHAADAAAPVTVTFPVPLRTSSTSSPSMPAAFSFSGLKSAVQRWTQRPGVDVRDRRIAAAGAAAFQRAAAAHITDQLAKAIAHCDALAAAGDESAARLRHVVVCGGVAANAFIRDAVSACAQAAGRTAVFPPRRYCTDNAVMIAWAAAERIAAGCATESAPDAALAAIASGASSQPIRPRLGVRPRWPLTEVNEH